MDRFGEDAEPFDLRSSELDDDDFDDFDLEDATEDDIDFVIGAYREDGRALAVPMDVDLANDLDELIRQLQRLPGDHGAFGFVSIAGDIFVLVHVRGQEVNALLSDGTAANDWPIARDVMDFLGEDIPDEDEDSQPAGDVDMLETFGVDTFELEAIANDYDEDSAELVARIAHKLKIDREFEAALGAFDS